MKITVPLFLWFLRTVLAQNSSCDYHLTVKDTDTIQSPGYPDDYPAGLNCLWMIDCLSGNNCHLNCSNIEIPESESCEQDRLLISRTGDPYLYGAQRYCDQTSFSVTSVDSTLTVGLITDSDTSGGKFKCVVTSQPSKQPRVRGPDCKCGERRLNRIVGGEETAENEYPMMAGLVDTRIPLIKCGGVIICIKYVLTAAHCAHALPLEYTSVVVGAHEDVEESPSPYMKEHEIDSYIIHPDYNNKTLDNDITLVVVKTPIELTDRVGLVCLPFKFVGNDFTGEKVTALGWGLTEHAGPKAVVLQQVQLDVISQSECEAMESDITERIICTYTPGKDACQMDSGGPLLFTDPETGLLFNVGIVSTGHGCARKGYPGVFTRVTKFLDWITSNTNVEYCRK